MTYEQLEIPLGPGMVSNPVVDEESGVDAPDGGQGGTYSPRPIAPGQTVIENRIITNLLDFLDRNRDLEKRLEETEQKLARSEERALRLHMIAFAEDGECE